MGCLKPQLRLFARGFLGLSQLKSQRIYFVLKIAVNGGKTIVLFFHGNAVFLALAEFSPQVTDLLPALGEFFSKEVGIIGFIFEYAIESIDFFPDD